MSQLVLFKHFLSSKTSLPFKYRRIRSLSLTLPPMSTQAITFLFNNFVSNVCSGRNGSPLYQTYDPVVRFRTSKQSVISLQY